MPMTTALATHHKSPYPEIEGHRIYIRFVLVFLSLISYKKGTQYPFLKLS